MADVVVKVAEASELLKIKQNTNILASRALAPKHNVEAAATDKLHFLASRALSEGLTEPRHFYHQLFSYDEKEISWTEAPSTVYLCPLTPDGPAVFTNVHPFRRKFARHGTNTISSTSAG